MIDWFLATAHFLEAHNGAVTAIATVVIAAFTIILAVVTKRQAEMTKSSADAAQASADVAKRALTDLERPYIYIMCTGFLRYDWGSGHAYTEYSVINHGKSAAIVETVIVSFAPSHTGAPEDGLHEEFMHPLLMNRVIGPGLGQTYIRAEPPGNRGFDMTKEGVPVPRLESNEEMFLHVIVKYRGPFTRGHETSACWRLDTSITNRFFEYGYETYNYVK